MTSEDPTRALIDALETEAELVDRGSFSVDLAVAGDKLRRSQLAEPAAWAVVAVEAGMLLGVTRVELGFRSGAITIGLHDVTLDADDFPALSLLTRALDDDSPGRDRREALRLLAAAYRTLQGRGIDRLTIDGGAGTRLRWTPDGGQTIESTRAASGSVAITVELPRLIDIGRVERRQILARCRCAAIDIFVDGDQIARGRRAAFGDPRGPLAIAAWVEPRILTIDGESAGLIGLHCERGSGARMLLLGRGIVVEDVDLGDDDDSSPGFTAVVEAPRLRRDLSLGKVLRDEEFERIHAAVDHARRRWIAAHPQLAARRNLPMRRSQAALDASPGGSTAKVALALGLCTTAIVGGIALGSAWVLLPVLAIGGVLLASVVARRE